MTPQLVIPMSGFGERFRRAGYAVPKPLIPVEGQPIIAHVLDLFPGLADVTFVCNADHLAEPGFRLAETLAALCPSGRIVSIAPHKLGPVHAVAQCWDELDAERPVVVNYCDFACLWDWEDFQRFVVETACDGAIPCYRGFHPHMLGSTSYAYLKTRDGWGEAIQEKAPFTDSPMQEYASSGTYYFASAALLRRYAEETIARELTVGGEYYVSRVYEPMLEQGRSVAVYELPHFMQWGTPEDLAEYEYGSGAFRALAQDQSPRPRQRGAVLLPMAGQGSRFTAVGIQTPKPLIEVSGRPMVAQAVGDLPEADRLRYVLRRDLSDSAGLQRGFEAEGEGVDVALLDGPTDGQARSCRLGLAGLDPGAPLTIGACDNGALYDAARLQSLLDDPSVDLIVWVARGYPGAARKPGHFGWVLTQGDEVSGVQVKQSPADPATDPVIIGTFTFRRLGDFEAAVDRLFDRDGRVRGEFYVDSCLEDALALGLRCVIFEVDYYLCWGTPDDLNRFAYWQSCFDKWPAHPYTLAADGRVPAGQVAALREQYAVGPAPRPGRPAGGD